MDVRSQAERNVAQVREALDAINTGDMARLGATVTPDFRRNDLARAFVLDGNGSDPLTAFITTVRAALPDFHMGVVDIFATADQAAVLLRLTGTHAGEFMGNPPSGRHIEISGVSLYRFRDGLICENTQLLDIAGLMRELGAAPAAGAAAAT